MARRQSDLDIDVLHQAVSWGLLTDLVHASFCQTGTMSVTRQEMDVLISASRGEVHNTVKSTTDYLIVPNGEFRKGSKYQAALSHGTKIITEQEFCEMIMPRLDDLIGDSNGAST